MVTVCGTSDAAYSGDGKSDLVGLALDGGDMAVLVWRGLGTGFRDDL